MSASTKTDQSFGDTVAGTIAESNGVDSETAKETATGVLDRLPLIQEAQVIGGALITIVIVGIVLNQFFQTSIVNTSSGPFSGVFSSAESIGVAGLTIAVVGVLVVAGNAVMGFFGGNFR